VLDARRSLEAENLTRAANSMCSDQHPRLDMSGLNYTVQSYEQTGYLYTTDLFIWTA